MRDKYRALLNEITNEDIYYELTHAGIALSAVLGIIAEAIVLMGFGIHPGNVPVVVLGFLWLLFGILVSGILIAIEMLEGIAFGRDYVPTAPAAATAEAAEPAVRMAKWNKKDEVCLRKAA